MRCKRCGCEVDTRKRRADGSVQCPKCGVIYRPRTAPQANASHSTARKGTQSKTVWDKIKMLPWKKKYWKLPLWAWVALAIIIIGGIGSLGDNSSTNSGSLGGSATSNQAAINSPTAVPAPSGTPIVSETDDALPTATAEAIDDPLSYAAEKVFKSEYTFDHQNENDVYIRFRIDGMNSEWTLKDFKLDIADYCKMLSTQFPDVDYGTLYFVGYCSTIDVYGQQGFQDAVRLAIDKDAVDRIVWENFLFDDIDQIGHDYAVGGLLKD